MSLIHLARQGFITKSALPNVTRQRGTTTGTANLMLYGAGKNYAIGTNTTFTDSSSNNFTVTRNGDTIQATNNPFTGSVYFDGNGDYLSNSTNNSSIAFGSGDFTLEFYIYSTSTASQIIYDTRINTGSNTGGFQIYRDSTTIYVYDTTGAGTLLASTSISTNVWTHFAIVRSGSATGNVKLYKDGVLASSSAAANTTDYSQGYINIGCYQLGGVPSAFLFGYLSNFRIVKGTAVYTSNFTVPTSPLTAITNTQLLLLTAQQAPFRDSSTNNFTVTANGNAAGNGLEPFPVNYAGSAYFDGTGDYLSVADNAALQPGTGIFTIEAWIYRNASGTAHTIYAKGGASTGFVFQVTATNVLRFIDTTTNIDSTGTISATTWTHVAVVRSGTGTNETKLYINGTQDGQGTVTTDFNQTEQVRVGTNRSAAENFAGYISNCRFVKGTAVYTAAFTPPSAPLTAVTNTSLLLLTNNVGPFVDTSANGFPVLRNGDAVQTGFSPFTGQPSAGSGYYDGNGDYLSIPYNSAFNLSSGDWTVELWWYPTSTSIYDQNLIMVNYSGGEGYAHARITATTANRFYMLSSSTGSTWLDTTQRGSWSLNQWHHLAYVRSGSTFTLYVNGVSAGSYTSSSTLTNNSGVTEVGRNNYSGPFPASGFQYTYGYISNARVIKGTALYTSNFTPATAPLPAVPNTSLLLNTDNYTIANSTPTYLPVTVNGNTTVSTAQYPTGMNRSIYFDGTGDYLSNSTNNSSIAFGSGDFTLEFYIYSTSTASQVIYDTRITVGGSANDDGAVQIYRDSTTIYVYDLTGATALLASTSISTNVWTHFAVVRSGSATGNVQLYKNGTLASSSASANTTNYTKGYLNIGAYMLGGVPSAFFVGYLSNFRIVKGSALYTSNFTPPSLPMSISVTVPAYVTNNIYGVYQLA